SQAAQILQFLDWSVARQNAREVATLHGEHAQTLQLAGKSRKLLRQTVVNCDLLFDRPDTTVETSLTAQGLGAAARIDRRNETDISHAAGNLQHAHVGADQ